MFGIRSDQCEDPGVDWKDAVGVNWRDSCNALAWVADGTKLHGRIGNENGAFGANANKESENRAGRNQLRIAKHNSCHSTETKLWRSKTQRLKNEVEVEVEKKP